jgi:hypothetical protein
MASPLVPLCRAGNEPSPFPEVVDARGVFVEPADGTNAFDAASMRTCDPRPPQPRARSRRSGSGRHRVHHRTVRDRPSDAEPSRRCSPPDSPARSGSAASASPPDGLAN